MFIKSVYTIHTGLFSFENSLQNHCTFLQSSLGYGLLPISLLGILALSVRIATVLAAALAYISSNIEHLTM